MSLSYFLKYLALSTIATIALFFLINIIVPILPHIQFLWWSILCYVLLAGLIYFLVERSFKTRQGNTMVGLVIFNVFLKLVFTFGFVAIYVNLKEPTDRLFLVPLLLTYLIFTIFETWFLNIQAREVK